MERKEKERKAWKRKEWKIKNLEIIKSRMTGWQLETFKESYNHKVKKGISIFKKKQLEND